MRPLCHPRSLRDVDCLRLRRLVDVAISSAASTGLGLTDRLPDGLYPFADRRLPLSELAMMEAPRDLERLLRESAQASGVTIIRDTPVELRCTSDWFPDATFLVFWPSGEEASKHPRPEVGRHPPRVS